MDCASVVCGGLRVFGHALTKIGVGMGRSSLSKEVMMKLSAVIERAINNRLWNGSGYPPKAREKRCMRSCTAVYAQLYDLGIRDREFDDECRACGVHARLVDSIKGHRKQQEFRALWLTMLAHVLREEGR